MLHLRWNRRLLLYFPFTLLVAACISIIGISKWLLSDSSESLSLCICLSIIYAIVSSTVFAACVLLDMIDYVKMWRLRAKSKSEE